MASAEPGLVDPEEVLRSFRLRPADSGVQLGTILLGRGGMGVRRSGAKDIASARYVAKQMQVSIALAISSLEGVLGQDAYFAKSSYPTLTVTEQAALQALVERLKVVHDSQKWLVEECSCTFEAMKESRL